MIASKPMIKIGSFELKKVFFICGLTFFYNLCNVTSDRFIKTQGLVREAASSIVDGKCVIFFDYP